MLVIGRGELEINNLTDAVKFIPPNQQNFKTVEFYDRDVAVEFCKFLMQNPHQSIARVFPVFQIEDRASYFVAWELLGRNLRDMEKFVSLWQDGDESRYPLKHRLSSLYKTILRTLFSAVGYMIDNSLSWSYDMDDIYVKNDIPLLVGLEPGKMDPKSHYSELAKLIRSMNEKCEYKPGLNKEMETLLCCIDPVRRRSIRDNWRKVGRELPLLFSSTDINDLVLNVGDELKKSNIDDKYWPDDFSESINSIFGNSDLIELSQKIVEYETRRDARLTKNNKASLDNIIPLVHKSKNFEAIMMSRKSIVHFDLVKLHDDMKSEEDMINIFDSVAPNYLTHLVCIANTLEKKKPSLRGTLIPKKKFLEDLFGNARA